MDHALGARSNVARKDQEPPLLAESLYKTELLQRAIDGKQRPSSHCKKVAVFPGASRKRSSDTVDGRAVSKHH